MTPSFTGKILAIAGIVLGVGLTIRYLLPVVLPFLAGGLIAVAAEPLVRVCVRRLRMPRGAAAGISVSVTLVMLLGLVSLLGAWLISFLGSLVSSMPDLEETATQASQLLEGFLLDASQGLPGGTQNVVQRTIQGVFADGNALLSQVTAGIPEVINRVLGWVPGGAMNIGTAVFSSFLISARLPKLKKAITQMPWYQRLSPGVRRMKSVLGLWLKAQGKLCLTTFAIVAAGLFVLGLPNPLIWALVVAVVDGVPMVGSGVVLIPWALVSLLQHDHFRAIGLLCIYGVAFISRSVLEPRIVGKQLGLDPLMTLVFLYAGFRFFGLTGLLLAPFLATAVKMLLQKAATQENN